MNDNIKKFPQYVLMNGKSALRLVYNNKYERHQYYLDAGDWEVDIHIWGDGSFSSLSSIGSINGCKLIPTTRKKWEETNKDYACKHDIIGYLIEDDVYSVSTELDSLVTHHKYLLIR